MNPLIGIIVAFVLLAAASALWLWHDINKADSSDCPTSMAIILERLNGEILRVICDDYSNQNFYGTHLTLTWNKCGTVVILDMQNNVVDEFDSYESQIVRSWDNIVSWHIEWAEDEEKSDKSLVIPADWHPTSKFDLVLTNGRRIVIESDGYLRMVENPAAEARNLAIDFCNNGLIRVTDNGKVSLFNSETGLITFAVATIEERTTVTCHKLVFNL